jgi:hypothetical protein
MSVGTSAQLLLLHFFVTSALTGLIWTIQVVHYPLFSYVATDRFVRFEQTHSFRISTLVGPLMGTELVCALIIAWKRSAEFPTVLAWGSLALLMLIHLCTVIFSVRAHTVLGRGFDSTAHRMLVRTNWIRTVGWSVRSVLAAYMLWLFVNGSLTVASSTAAP